MVERLRSLVAQWRPLALRGEGGVTRITTELLNYWHRDGREHRLFFAQLEAAETIIFLTEARVDLLQGIDIPMDEPGADKTREGYSAFRAPLLPYGNRFGQDNSHGNAGCVEYIEQNKQSTGQTVRRCNTGSMPQRYHP